jgi:hypothetical protein
MLKIGLEVEFFGAINGLIVNVAKHGIPHDEYPLLAEARGLANTDVYQAVASVRGEIEKIVESMKLAGITPLFENWIKKDKHTDALHDEILRSGIHKHIGYRNLTQKTVSRKNKSYLAAGLHVSLTKGNSFHYTNENKVSSSHNYNELFDFPLIFNKISEEFKNEMAESERVPGFYEVKSDGRVEYRSLPANIIFNQLFAARLNKCIKL